MSKKRDIFGLPLNVVLLGLVSFFTDMSSEIILPLLPLFLLSMGASVSAIGLIEGIAESSASLLKVYSGWYSDKIGKRKVFVSSGYALSAVAKLFFALAIVWHHVLAIRFVERIGKGLRTSPRDALIADSTDAKSYGKAFGFHRAMDTSGAIFGVLLALVLVSYFTYRQIFIIAFIPAAIYVIFVLKVKEKRKMVRSVSQTLGIKNLDRRYKLFLVAATIFALANFSYVFLILMAKDIGISDRGVISLYLLFNIVYTFLAMPAGVISDKIPRKQVIVAGYMIFGAMCAGFVFASTPLHMVVLFGIYGVYYAIIEGVQKAYIADLVDADARGTAYGAFHTVVGLAAFPASLIAGLLWQYIGPFATFAYGALLALLAASILTFISVTLHFKN